MATTKHEVTGRFEWCKLFEHDRDREYNKTSVNVYPDANGMKVIKASGTRISARTNDSGETYYSFKRDWEAPEEWMGGPPKVFRPDGKKWNVDMDGLIGNGSTGVVFLDVYDTRMGKGTRISGVQIIDHVSYSSEGGSGGFNVRDYTGGASQQEDAPQDVPSSRDLDDEVPF